MEDGETSLAMATIRDESGPLAEAIFHLRDQRDKACLSALLDIFIIILPLIPTNQEDGRVVSDIRQLLERLAGALHGT